MAAPGAGTLAGAAVSRAARRRLTGWVLGSAGGFLALLLSPLFMVALTVFLVVIGPGGPTKPPAPGEGPTITGDWAIPVANYTLSDGFGPRDPVDGCASCSTWHRAQDFSAECGEPAYAASAGTVTAAEVMGTYGYMITIDHGGGVETLYAHFTAGSFLVDVGSLVTTGQQIAEVGTTGGSTGCHLHLEVRLEGERSDPVPFFAGLGITL